ncbi:MAG: hypothetical protein AAF460_06185 [Pseudomonadota bacterium]
METGQYVGGLRWPDVAVATNARLKDTVPAALSQTIDVVFDGVEYNIEHTHTTRGFAGNSVRYRLVRDRAVLASALVELQPGWFRRPVARLESPVEGELVKLGYFGVRYAIRCGTDTLGHIRAQGGLRLTHEHRIELTERLGGPIQVFLYALFVIREYP